MRDSNLSAIVITGISKAPVNICIDGENVLFDRAKEDWGKPFSKCDNKKYASSIFASIAAENLVRYSSPLIDGCVAGRGGIGAVMGIKKIKAITFAENSATRPCPEGLEKANEDILRLVNASPALNGKFGFANFGTAALYDLVNSRRMLPINNFRETFFAQAKDFNAWTIKNKYGFVKKDENSLTENIKLNDGRPFPEYEAIASLGCMTGNDSLEEIIEANALCNDYGIDPVSLGGTIACMLEIEKRTLKINEIIEIIETVAKTDGKYAGLSQGSRRYAQEKGSTRSAITVKGMELSPFDPRGALGMGLSLGTSTRGGVYDDALAISHEILRKPIATDRFSFSGKARIIKGAEDTVAVADCLGIDRRFLYAAGLEEYSKAFSAVMGEEYTAYNLLEVGERVWYAERIINNNRGFDIDDDMLPLRFYNEKGSSGDSINIEPVNIEEYTEELKSYYKIRGLGDKGGPMDEKIEELGLICNV
jgi:aldehyde:ferredoxin oxidoreductase